MYVCIIWKCYRLTQASEYWLRLITKKAIKFIFKIFVCHGKKNLQIVYHFYCGWFLDSIKLKYSKPAIIRAPTEEKLEYQKRKSSQLLFEKKISHRTKPLLDNAS